MTTYGSPYPHPSYAATQRPEWFEPVLPTSAAPLIGLLILVFPLFLLALESLLAPVMEYVQSLLMPVNAGVPYTSMPWYLVIKIALFLVFTFTGITLLILKITCLYYEVWSHYFDQPHPEHPPYHPDAQDSMVSLFNWGVFRVFRILAPSLMWIGLTIAAALLWFWFFTAFTNFGFLTFQLQFTLGIFAMGVLGFFSFLSLFGLFANVFKSILGDVAAITEPEKPAQTLYDRVQSIAFASPWAVILYPLYLVFYLLVAVEIILFWVNYDISDLFNLNPSMLIVYGVTVATFAMFIVLQAMKFMTYHDALKRAYKRILR